MISYKEFEPIGFARGFVDRYWEMYPEDDVCVETQSVLPDGFPEIVFNTGENFQQLSKNKILLQPDAIVAGQMNQSIDLMTSKKFSLFGVRLHPFGLHLLTGIPAFEFNDQILSLEDVFGSEADFLFERISAADDISEKISVFEAHIYPKGLPDVPGWMSLYTEQGCSRSTSEVAVQSGVSVKTIQRRFRKYVGISPKRFQRIRRIQTVVSHFETFGAESLTEVAYQNGYFDQSHFIRDFKTISGLTPGSFMGEYSGITEALAR